MNLNNLHNFPYPPSLLKLIGKIESSGAEIFIIGGAVRDILLGIEPHEFDLTTNALSSEIDPLFSSTNTFGSKYGCITVNFENNRYELTTYRKEAQHLDMRHPNTIAFVRDIKEDLPRRDFTINALAYNPISKIFIDDFSGLQDLENKLIRCIGNSALRFSEDALRMLRAIRFASQLGFSIEQETLAQITPTLLQKAGLPLDRLKSEFNKIILGTHAQFGIKYLVGTGLMQYYIPEYMPPAEPNINQVTAQIIDRLKYVLDSVEVEKKKVFLQRFNYSKKVIKSILY